MMQLFEQDGNAIGLFKSFEELSRYINAVENAKLEDTNSYFPEEIWSFSFFTNKRLSYIYYKILEQSFSKIGKDAFEQGLDLIEISKGDGKEPLQVPVTPDVDIQELKKNWCHDYCDAHGYTLVDYQNNFESHSAMEAIPVANRINGGDVLGTYVG
jgi:hypothetical protein